MVGFLKYFKRDPNGKGRGAGYYYHRGKGYYSKYSETKDKKYRARPKVVKKGKKKVKYKTAWKPNKIGFGLYKHTRD